MNYGKDLFPLLNIEKLLPHSITISIWIIQILSFKKFDFKTIFIITYSNSVGCNNNCGCIKELYNPVCSNGITYLSPCLAGCQTPAGNNSVSILQEEYLFVYCLCILWRIFVCVLLVYFMKNICLCIVCVLYEENLFVYC